MKQAIHDDEDKAFLGFVVHDNGSWTAQTIFGYIIARTPNRKAAEQAVRSKGRTYLEGTWQYFDKDDQQWNSCVIQDAQEHRVTIVRTNDMGYQDPESYKLVILKEPKEDSLIKNS